jgi:hypothetical protein
VGRSENALAKLAIDRRFDQFLMDFERAETEVIAVALELDLTIDDVS